VRGAIQRMRLPAAAKAEERRDRRGLPAEDPGPETAAAAALDWILTAQDRSATADGGVARDFSLVRGWAASYPETTGYIVPTLLVAAERLRRPDAAERARRMLDWLVSIQLDGGAFQGGTIGAAEIAPVVFNTGQILMGLAAGARAFGEPYRGAMRRAADWLCEVQDGDGCWRRFGSPFAAAGDKVYDTHVAWGLFEAARAEPERRAWGDAGMANVHWALERQAANGWFADCCLSDPTRPLTHTLGYALRGVIEGHRDSGNAALLAAALRTGEGLASCVDDAGFLPGRLDRDWRAAADWSCLTGSVQIAACWLLLHEATGETRWLDVARRVNAWVRRTISLDGPVETRGAVKGSFPVSGGYCTWQYPNWAAKFFIDACFLETDAVHEAARPARSTSSGD